MARIATDPNYSSPTFPRATAGTDLFVKEDVQALASAVSTHTHGAGKGLPVDTVANGAITTAMLAANAVTLKSGWNADGSTYTRTSVNAGLVAVPGVPTVTLTFTGQPVLVFGQITWQHSAAGAIASVGFLTDSMPTTAMNVQFSIANYNQPTSFVYYATVSAGAHTISLAWDNNAAGTLQRNAWWSSITVVELKR